jgi:hypothetical protein
LGKRKENRAHRNQIEDFIQEKAGSIPLYLATFYASATSVVKRKPPSKPVKTKRRNCWFRRFVELLQ